MRAGKAMVQCLLNNHKIMSCGNGGSAADAQHFAASQRTRVKGESSMPESGFYFIE